MSLIRRFACVTAIALAVGDGPVFAAGLRYVATDIGSFPGGTETDNRAYGINNYGQVVGRSRVAIPGSSTTSAHVFLWTPGVANGTDGTLTDVEATPSGPAGTDVAVNDRGQVLQTDGILWSPDQPHGTTGSFMTLPPVAGGPPGVIQPAGINGSGQVVGLQAPGTSVSQAYVWTPAFPNGTTGTAALLGPDYSSATDINDAGQIVGTSAAATRGFLYTPATTGGTFTDLPVPSGFAWVQPTAINAAGSVAGYAWDDANGPTAFRWRPDAPNGTTGTAETIVGPAFTDSRATDVNGSGLVVGYGTPTMPAIYGQHAFVWSDTDGMLDLNTLLTNSIGSWELASAVGINDAGQIAVTAAIVPPDYSMKPVYHAFLLTPAVPEPGAALLAGGAAGVFTGARRRRRRAGAALQWVG